MYAAVYFYTIVMPIMLFIHRKVFDPYCNEFHFESNTSEKCLFGENFAFHDIIEIGLITLGCQASHQFTNPIWNFFPEGFNNLPYTLASRQRAEMEKN